MENKNKVLGPSLIFFICLLVIIIAIVATKGFKVGLKYSENTQLNINIGTEFEVKDLKEITKEVFKKKSVIVQQVELYKDMAQITIKDSASDDELQDLVTKINEKYGTELQTSDILISNNANTKLKDIAKPYMLPISITFGVILVYVLIRFHKIGFRKVFVKTIKTIINPQILLFGIYAIFRIPINRVTIILSIIFYIYASYKIILKLLEENEGLKKENKIQTEN